MDFTIHKSKAIAIGALPITFCAWVGWAMLGRIIWNKPLAHPPLLNVLLLTLFVTTAVSMSLLTVWYLYKAWKTKISRIGISQPQLRGRVELRWVQFKSLEGSSRTGIHLIHPGGKLLVATALYSDPDALESFLRQKVAESSSPS